MNEKQKMCSGALYDPTDAQLVRERSEARERCLAFNACAPADLAQQRLLLKALFPDSRALPALQAPFFCDYGYNVDFAEGVFLNFNCVILDVAPVRIGARSMFGPAVQIYTATHPMNARERAKGLESGVPITIGADVWIGGAAIVCPGVQIGDGAVIGAGSVVTKSIPPGVFAAGNPCRVLRAID